MKILIIRLSSLGDVILSQPIAASLRDAYPEAQIDFITKPAFKPIVEKFDCLDNIIDWDESLACLLKIKRANYDICIDLHAKFNTWIIKIFCRAKKTATYNKKHGLRKAIVKHKTDKSISSTVQLYYSALEKLQIPYKKSYPQIYMENLPTQKSSQTTIGIFPGATYKTKQYPPEKIIELINLFPPSWIVKLFGSTQENELSAKIADSVNREIINLTGQFNLDKLCAEMMKLDLIISNDSGPMHLAAALNKPQIAIFGATDPALGFAPLNKKSIIINHKLECKPCSLHGSESCPEKHFKCMLSHDNQLIYDNIKKLI